MQTDTLPPAEPTEASPPRRAIRSFVVRAGRMGPGQARALAELGPRFLVSFVVEPVHFVASFGLRAAHWT
jgi:tRNA (guanine-N7-)-methyltransferase